MKAAPKHEGYYDTEGEAIRLAEAMRQRLLKESQVKP